MTTYNNELFISWDGIQAACAQIAARIIEDGRSFERVLAITRGGLFPAGIIARELDIRQVETIGIDTYDDQEQKSEPAIIKLCREEFLKDTLIIDDLVDTGATIKKLKDQTDNCYFVAVFAKPEGLPLVDLYHSEVPQDTWIRFPWDTRRQYSEPLARNVS